MLMYVLTAGVIGSIGLYVLLGSARYVVGWGLYVGMATIWIASTIWFSKRFEKYRIDVMRRRRHAANRQISTTPLPSPTTPEDSQT